MAQVKQSGQAGIADKSDVLVTIEPREPGTGRHITETVEAVLNEQDIDDVAVLVEDKGALEFALRARCETALRRALKE